MTESEPQSFYCSSTVTPNIRRRRSRDAVNPTAGGRQLDHWFTTSYVEPEELDCVKSKRDGPGPLTWVTSSINGHWALGNDRWWVGTVTASVVHVPSVFFTFFQVFESFLFDILDVVYVLSVNSILHVLRCAYCLLRFWRMLLMDVGGLLGKYVVLIYT